MFLTFLPTLTTSPAISKPKISEESLGGG